MPGVKEAELKARRRRSAAQLTSGLQPVSGAGRGAPGADLEPVVAGCLGEPEEEFKGNRIRENVVMAERAEDGCCARIARYWWSSI